MLQGRNNRNKRCREPSKSRWKKKKEKNNRMKNEENRMKKLRKIEFEGNNKN
jgi:hypothetical protein